MTSEDQIEILKRVINDLVLQNQELRFDNDKFIKALSFYEDKANYQYAYGMYIDANCEIGEDLGKKAHKALK